MADQNITQIERQIRKLMDDAADLRRQAQTERDRANQTDQAEYHNNQAMNLDQRADELESQVPEMESQKNTMQQRLEELRQEKERIDRETSDKLMAIEREANQISGSTFGF
jgi:chromosome segregation ATPase